MASPLKVLALYATFAPDINEMAMVWKRLTDAGRVQARVLAGGSDPLKNTHTTLAHERLPNLEIRRVAGTLYPGQGTLTEDDIEWAAAFRPDVIFCNLHVNMVWARRIAARCGAPIRLHVEHWRHIVLPRRQYLGVPALQPVVSAWLRRTQGQGARAIAISDPTDRLSARPRPREAYLPHPHPRPAALRVLARQERRLDEVVFVGSISGWKGAERLGEYFERLLQAEPALRVRIVGPLGDDTARAAVARLEPWMAADRASHVPHLPRQEALELIGGALAVFNPNATGWGLIGDAWAAGTPVLAGERHYDILPGRNAWLVSTGEEFVDAVRLLRDDAATWQRYADAGLALAREEHSIDVVAERLWGFLHDQPLPVSAARRA